MNQAQRMPAMTGKLCNGQAFKFATGRIRPIGGPGSQETASYVSNLLGSVDSKLTYGLTVLTAAISRVQMRPVSPENRLRQQRLPLQFRLDAGALRDRLVRNEPLPRVLRLQGH